MKCSICNHTEKEKLNIELINETPLRDIEKFFKVSRSALSRHQRWCLPAIVAGALQTTKGSEDEEDGPEPSTVLGKSQEMSGKARLAILHALKRKDYKTAFSGMREHRGYAELAGRITGELTPESRPRELQPMFILPPGTHIDVVVSQRPEREIRNVTPALPENTESRSEG